MGSMYGESIGAITFDFSDLERSSSRSLRFCRLISLKGAELRLLLLLKTYRKSHVGSATTQSHLTLNDFVRLKSSRSDFEGLYIVKRAKIDHMVLVNPYGTSKP